MRRTTTKSENYPSIIEAMALKNVEVKKDKLTIDKNELAVKRASYIFMQHKAKRENDFVLWLMLYGRLCIIEDLLSNFED